MGDGNNTLPNEYYAVSENMSRLRHIYEPGMTYLLTTITRRRERLFEKAGLVERPEDYPYLSWNADWLT